MIQTIPTATAANRCWRSKSCGSQGTIIENGQTMMDQKTDMHGSWYWGVSFLPQQVSLKGKGYSSVSSNYEKKRKRLFHDLPLPPTPVGSTQVNSALGSPGRVYYTHNRASISFLNLIACGSIFDAGILLSILMLQRWLSVDFFEDINIKLCCLLLYVPAKLHDIWQPIRYADGTVLWASLGVSSP